MSWRLAIRGSSVIDHECHGHRLLLAWPMTHSLRCERASSALPAHNDPTTSLTASAINNLECERKRLHATSKPGNVEDSGIESGYRPTNRNGGEREPMVVVSLDALKQSIDRDMVVVGIDEDTLGILPALPKYTVEDDGCDSEALD